KSRTYDGEYGLKPSARRERDFQSPAPSQRPRMHREQGRQGISSAPARRRSESTEAVSVGPGAQLGKPFRNSRLHIRATMLLKINSNSGKATISLKTKPVYLTPVPVRST